MKHEHDLYTKGSIMVLRLVTGEEIVTEIKSHHGDEGTIHVKQPFQVHIVNDGQGGRAKTLLPLMMLAPESDVTLYLHKIVAYVAAPTEVEKAYIQETSGILLSR
jgi:hypothetical protein